jgi:hypothetical protein
MQARYEVAHVLRAYWDRIDHLGLNSWQVRTLKAIRDCRTAALGGHIDSCDDCGMLSISYNSCRNRHCPKCQGEKRNAWIQARSKDLMPVPYFHVVFTLPSRLNQLAICYPREVYDSLFEAAWATLSQFFRRAHGVQGGMIAVLHTWGQNMSLHPHVHCIVPGGGIDQNDKWRATRSNGKFLFPVKAMSLVYKAKYLKVLRQRLELDTGLGQELYRQKWIVYAKRPFGKAQHVVEYLGRYSHKIAISNHRIQQVDEQTVSFNYKDYRAGGQKKIMKLSHDEFIRRFSQHILPKRFMRIRHFGILSSTWKRGRFQALQEELTGHPVLQEKGIKKPRICPCCRTGHMHIIIHFGPRGPPAPSEDVLSSILSALLEP